MSYLNLNNHLQTKPTRTVLPSGLIAYTLNGVLHREDGPAVITSWSHEYYVGGVLHREDGPARMFLQHPQPTSKTAKEAKGKFIVEWYLNGKYSGKAALSEAVFKTHWKAGAQ
jgi:hypothetical protein